MTDHRASTFLAAAALLLSAGPLYAIDLELIDSSVANPEQTLIDALVQPGSGITVVPGSVQFIGRVGDGNLAQSAVFRNFLLSPQSAIAGGGLPDTVEIDDGIFLTSGVANIPATNTVNQWDHGSAGVAAPGTGDNADLSALAGVSTNDQNVLTFQFTLDNPGDNALTIDFVFGSDEFPTQSVTDVFGFFVDGVNYAEFPSGSLVGNNDDSQFIDNPVGSGLFAIEYNGFTPRFSVVGPVDGGLSTHTAVIAIADTSDSIFDSGVFVSSARGGSGSGGIGGGDEPIEFIPVPVMNATGLIVFSMLMLLPGLAGLRSRF